MRGQCPLSVTNQNYKIMGYNTDWNGSLKTSRPFTRLELNAWNEMAEEKYPS